MVLAFIPGDKFIPISITGLKCELMCKYCMGRYLRGMYTVETPLQLYKFVKKMYKRNVRGFLISGGFNRYGKLPYKPFLEAFRRIKREMDVILSIHPGLVDKNDVKDLENSGIDIVDYEFIIDEEVIHNIMGLNADRNDFIKSLYYLTNDTSMYVAPHISIGFKYGLIDREMEAFNIVKEFKPYIIILLIFIPTKNTPMDKYSPPKVNEIVDLFRKFRKNFREDLALGCMRPHFYKLLLDPLLIEEKLVDRIAVPDRKVIKKYGLKIVNVCCSLPKNLYEKFISD